MHTDAHARPPFARFAERVQRARRTEWHLTEHFFRAMFDFGILTAAGADSFKHMLLGTIGGVVAGGLLMTRVYGGKYAVLQGASHDFYTRAVIGDDLVFVGLPMVLVAFVTLMVSGSLFPDERDVRILGPLPVRKTVIFTSKLTALGLFSGLFIALLHVALLPLVVLTSIDPFREHALAVSISIRVGVWVLTSVMASLFAVLAVTAIVGVLVLLLSRTRLHELSGIIRSALLALLVISLPLAIRLTALGDAVVDGEPWVRAIPPAWFVGLQQVLRGRDDPAFVPLALIAVAGFATVAAIVAATYVVLFRHVERLMRPVAAKTGSSSDAHPTPRSTRSAFRVRRGSPAFRAVQGFTLLTLRRSQLHQGVVIGLTACGLGLAINRFLGGNFTHAAIWTPFVLLIVCGLAVRSALALPMEHRANWIFRMTEDDATRRDQLRAVDRVVTMYVVGVPVIVGTSLLWIAMGPPALIAGVIIALVGFIVVHFVLKNWRRIPFTCSYLPGKRFIASSVVVGSIAYTLFPLIGYALIRVATARMKYAIVMAAILALIAYLLRRRRLAAWKDSPLMFEDELPDRPLELQLGQ